MVMSGFAGLGYQIIWTQRCALWLGHESAAVLAVIGAFFGGVSLGSFIADPRVRASTRAAYWYAACELLIACWSIVLAFAARPFSALVLRWIGAEPSSLWHWSAAFGGTFLLLLPATAAMGATLPVMERIATQLASGRAQIAALYAANTFGAVVGVLASAFLLVPRLGLTTGAICCAALNVICAVLALTLLPRRNEPDARPASPGHGSRAASVRLGVTGLLGIGYEVLVVRVLSGVTENTVYTFASLLAVYLVGTAVGAAAYQRWLSERGWKAGLDDVLLSLLAAACLVGSASLWTAETSMLWLRELLGHGLLAALATEVAAASFAFVLPTLVMGALFSHLAHTAHQSGLGYGHSLGINTLGAAVAPALFGGLVLPIVGSKFGLLLVVSGYLALLTRRAWRRTLAWIPAAGVIVLAALGPPIAFVTVSEGAKLVSYHEGVMAAVSVVEDADGTLRLRINNRAQEGDSASARVDGRQAWLPLLLHPSPERALFLGLGTGMTASAAAEDETLAVDAVELLPEVIDAAQYFLDRRESVGGRARLNVIAADARRYVRTSQREYDVVVSDNFHPARSGSGSLYTVEHFAAVRDILSSGGVFCQWLPLHQLDTDTLRSIVSSFLSVYPRALALLASNSLETPVIGLVGRREAKEFYLPQLRERVDRYHLPQRLSQLGLQDEFAVLGSFVAGPASLSRFAHNAPTNTDDRPIVAYLAPRYTYAPDAKPGDVLIALLESFTIQPLDVVEPVGDPNWARRLAAYWTARDRFIVSGRHVHATLDVRDMLAQVRDPLLSILNISPEFRPAYDPLVAMAAALATTDPRAASALLTELVRLQPERDEARTTLASIAKRAAAPNVPPQ